MFLIRAENWLFSIKTFLAGMLALAVAFWLDLPRPYWALATVYIASQPLMGATHSKAVFRAIGTFAGAGAAVAMVPNLVNGPLLLTLAIALWSGLCLYLSLLDRSPRGYAFMLAGYTTAIIGFPAVDAPADIFSLALSRTEEILVGIASAAFVSSVIFPRSVGPVVAGRVALWIKDAKLNLNDALHGETTALGKSHWLRLAADTTVIEGLAAHLGFEAGSDQRVLFQVRRLLSRMLMVLPEISAVSDCVGELSSLGGPSPQAATLIRRLSDILTSPSWTSGSALRDDIDARIGASLQQASWRELIELNLLVRLRDLSELLDDCDALAAALAADARSLQAPLLFPIDSRLSRIHHKDRGAALLASATLSAAIVICCLFWILADWRDGASAAMMTAVAASLFAAQDDPTPAIAKFALWSATAVAVAGVYVFFVLPRIHSFETLAIALAPSFLLFGLLIAEPKTFLIGLPLGLITASAMALQETYAADAEAFLNSGLAMVVGMTLAAAATAIFRVTGAEWQAARFARANKVALAEAANIKGRGGEARIMGLMFDRLSLLAPVVHASHEAMPDAMRQLRAGFNLLDARRARMALGPGPRRRLDAALMRLERQFERDLPLTEEALVALNRALQALRADEGRDRDALLALVGLRRCLFPTAPPPSLVFSGPPS
jgi:uncharacterized membrane protein YccC